MINTVILPIGGKGTRMREKSSHPKLLINLNGFPLIYYTISYLAQQKVKNIFFISNKSSNEIEKYVIDLCPKLNLKYQILYERELKGNFGGIIENFNSLPENFLVIYPDIIWTCDLSRIFNYHFQSQALITLVVRRTDHPEDSDTLKLNPLMSVKSIFSKENKTICNSLENYDLLGATGIYIMNKTYLQLCIQNLNKISKKTEIDLFQTIETLWNNENLHISAYITNEFIKDCGTPKRFKLVEKIMKEGNVFDSSYENKQKIIFIDRDGTLIKTKNKNYLTSPDEVELNDSMLSYYEKYTSDGYTPIVITNQPQISFGLINFETLDMIHCKIQQLLTEKKLTKIFKFLICPHHPHSGFKNEISFLKFTCACRKPNIGLFNEVERFIKVDKKKSIMFGDSFRDKEFAENCGINFQLIK